MKKNRFCTFTFIVSLALAALPGSLAAAAGSSGGSASSLPVQQEMTLTITPSGASGYSSEGSSYTAYRVMSFSQDATTGNWSWSMVNGFTYPGDGTFDADAFGSYPAAKLQNLAEKLALQATDSMQDKLQEKAISGGSASWTTDKAGIYLVCETKTAAGNFPTKPFLVALPYTDENDGNSWKYALTASPKGSKVDLQKLIHQAKGSYNNSVTYEGSKDTVAVGDEVQYLITTRIPSYSTVFFEGGKNPVFRLTDTMAKGLTLTENSVTLTSGGKTLEKETDYTQSVSTDQTTGITTLILTLKSSYLSVPANQDQELVLSCSAVVNENVSLADDGNENKVKLDYSYDPKNPDDTKKIEDDTKVYSFGIEVEKFDGDTDGTQKTMLKGARFALYKEKTKNCTAAEALSQEPYRAAVETGTNGLADFRGLDAGTYYVKEVKAPDGYSLLMNPIKVEIIPDSTKTKDTDPEEISSGAYTVKVNGTVVSTGETGSGVTRILNAENREETVIVAAANHKGFTLPSTGGSGIALILMISAVGLLSISLLYVRGGRKTEDEIQAI